MCAGATVGQRRLYVLQLEMSHFPHPNSKQRAARVRLGDAVPVLVLQQDGKRCSGKLQSISETGGLVRLSRPMPSGDLVEVAFQAASGPVRGMAEMLNPLLLNGCVLQPFRFIALADEDHHTLRTMVDLISDRISVMAGSRL